MRLVGYWFGSDGDGPVERAWLPLGDLTVILGVNDAGKSRFLARLGRDLDALEAIFRGAPAPNALVFAVLEPTELDELLAATYAARDAPRRRDPSDENPEAERLRQSLSHAEVIDGAAWLWRSLIQDDLGAPPEVVELLEGSRVLAFEAIREPETPAGHPSILLHWCAPPLLDLPEDQAIAVRAFATTGVPEDPELDPRAPTLIARVGNFDGPLLPAPVRLPVGVEFLHGEIVEVVGQWLMAARLLEEVASGDRELANQLETDGVLRFLEVPPPAEFWLDEAQPDRARTSRRALDALQAIERASRRACAPVVADRYEIAIHIAPIWEWGSSSPVRIRLEAVGAQALREDGRPGFLLSEAADGLKLWVELAIAEGVDALRLATARLAHDIINASGAVFEGNLEEAAGIASDALERDPLAADPFDASPAGPFYRRMMWWDYQSWGYGQHAVSPRALRIMRPPIYLIDEPERHLNPRLVRETARWLLRWLREHRSQAIIVTHAVGFLAAEEAQFVRVERVGGTSQLHSLEAAGMLELRGVCEDLGYDRGELLGLARLLLYVEGETDRAVLDALFGPRLWRAGIVVVSISGTRNHAAVAEAGVLLRYCDVPVAVVFDALDEEHLRRLVADRDYRRAAYKKGSTEAKSMARLLDLAEENNRVVTPLAFAAPDTFDVLDDAALADVFPGFPGRSRVAEEFGYGGGTSRDRRFWDLLRERYGIEKRVAHFREVAERMRELGRVPPELEAIVSEAEAIASEW